MSAQLTKYTGMWNIFVIKKFCEYQTHSFRVWVSFRRNVFSTLSNKLLYAVFERLVFPCHKITSLKWYQGINNGIFFLEHKC